MKPEEIQEYTSRCIHGYDAPCEAVCPLGMDVRRFMTLLEKKRWAPAYRQLKETMIFPDLVSRLCTCPCEKECTRSAYGEAVQLHELELAVLAHVPNKNPKRYNMPPKTQRVVIVGAGLSGLACAYLMAVKKYPVTVYEKNETWGGCLLSRSGLAPWLDDIGRQFSSEKTDFRFGEEVTDIDAIPYDALYIASGRDGSDFGLLDGWNKNTLASGLNGVFLGGQLGGADPLSALAEGKRAAAAIEQFLLTGNMPSPAEESAKKRSVCYRPENYQKIPRTEKSGEAYSPDEAVQESLRCLRCDCDLCMRECTMLSAYQKDPHQISLGIFHDTMVVPNVSSRTMTRQISSCSFCGLCRTVCPADTDIGAAILFARRDRVKSGTLPPVFHDYWLRQMEFFKEEAAVFIPPETKHGTGFVFFPGCQLGSSDPQYVLKPYAQLRERLGAGLILTCCGASADWAGEEEKRKAQNALVRERWEAWGKPAVILACASCERQWRQYLPEAECISLYSLLAKMDEENPEHTLLKEAVIFDPCAAREDSDMRRSVRQLAEQCGTEISELPFHDEAARCCGWGGHIQIPNPSLYEKIVDEAISADALPYIVYCANCRDSFAARGKQAAHILDLIYELDSGVRSAPSIKEKQDNALSLRRKLCREYLNEEIAMKEKPGADLALVIPEQTARRMERLFISEDDARAALSDAIADNTAVEDTETGISYTSFACGETIVWCGWHEEAGTYVLDTVYSHRMKILNEEGRCSGKGESHE